MPVVSDFIKKTDCDPKITFSDYNKFTKEILDARIKQKQEKKFSINLVKRTQNFTSFYINSDNNYLFVNGKEISKFKVDKENANFPAQFYLGSISSRFE